MKQTDTVYPSVSKEGFSYHIKLINVGKMFKLKKCFKPKYKFKTLSFYFALNKFYYIKVWLKFIN